MNEDELLFHGTGIYCLANIIFENKLLAGTHWGKPDEPHGPRFSEDYEVAKQFCSYCPSEGEGGVLILNANKLAKTYKLRAYRDRYFSGGEMPDEREIVAITYLIEPLSKYLESIVVDLSVIDLALTEDYMEHARNEGGWPFGDEADSVKKCHLALNHLGNHSLINVPVIDLDQSHQRMRMRMH